MLTTGDKAMVLLKIVTGWLLLPDDCTLNPHDEQRHEDTYMGLSVWFQ